MTDTSERGDATRRQIVAAATRLFAEHGYAGVSIEAVLAEVGISRGALYHHFAGKAALFEAAAETLEAEIRDKVIARSAGARDPIRAVRAGGEAFLELAQDPAVRRIVLTDAPSVLGWATWRQIQGRYGFGLLRASLARASAEGALPAGQVDVCAGLLLAALNELALVIAQSDDREAAAADARTALARLIAGLLGEPES